MERAGVSLTPCAVFTARAIWAAAKDMARAVKTAQRVKEAPARSILELASTYNSASKPARNSRF